MSYKGLLVRNFLGGIWQYREQLVFPLGNTKIDGLDESLTYMYSRITFSPLNLQKDLTLNCSDNLFLDWTEDPCKALFSQKNHLC